jgi:hypothetical protein
MATISELWVKARAQWAATGMEIVRTEAIDGLAEAKYGLRTQTGRLANSVLANLLPEKDGFKVGINVTYGRAWELGFTSPAITIVPKRAKVLAFPVDGKLVFAKRVKKPAKTFAPRPWLMPALNKCLPELQRTGETVFQEAINKGFPDRTIKI